MATGYLFCLRCDEQRRKTKSIARQGMIVDIIGRDIPRPAPTEPKPPPEPATRNYLFNQTSCGSRRMRQEFALIFVRGMTTDQYVRLAPKLKKRRVTRADVIAMMADDSERNRVRKSFDREKRITYSEGVTVSFAAFKAALRNNDNDDPVVVED